MPLPSGGEHSGEHFQDTGMNVVFHVTVQTELFAECNLEVSGEVEKIKPLVQTAIIQLPVHPSFYPSVFLWTSVIE